MEKFHRSLQDLGGVYYLTVQSFREMFQRPFYFRLMVEQIYLIGVKSLPLVLVVALATGMVMTIQFGWGLERFGGKPYVPGIVAVSLMRELGPVFCCLMIAARVGAGITSELGSMAVTQQIDAIRALGTSPIKRLVVPRVIAGLIAIPLICLIATLLGIWGALVVAKYELGLDGGFVMQKILERVGNNDLWSGIGKTPFFALGIVIIGCYYGFNIKGGTQGVGRATTHSVVASCVYVVIGDFFLTKLFMFFERLQM